MFVWVSLWLFRQGFSIAIVIFCKVIIYSLDVIYTFLFSGLNVRFNLSKTCSHEYYIEMIGRKTTLWTAQGMGTLVQTFFQQSIRTNLRLEIYNTSPVEKN